MQPTKLDKELSDQEFGVNMDSAASLPLDGSPRESLISTATNFLLSPKLGRVSETEQRSFLQRKGLSPTEIDMAFQRRMALTAAPAALTAFLNVPKRSNNGWVDFFNRLAVSVAIFSSASYALYWFVKTYVEPSLGQNRTEKYMAEIVQELRDMREERRRQSDSDHEYVKKTAKAIADLRDEMSSLKKMLLARNQFAAFPSTTGAAVKIPSWQQSHQPSTSQAVDSKSPETQIEEQVTKQQEESAPDSGISPEATSSDGEVQVKEAKEKNRSNKKKRNTNC